MLAQNPGGATDSMTSETTWDESACVLQQGESDRANVTERPERENFEHIYQLYSRQVFSLCLRMTGNFTQEDR